MVASRLLLDAYTERAWEPSIIDGLRSTAATFLMNWEEYQNRFSEEAARQGKPRSFVEGCLAYAEILIKAGLPVIYDLTHLASETGVTEQDLLSLLEHPDAFYFHYQIPKRAGGFRPISEPLSPLRAIQCWILRNILDRCTPHDAAKAFVRGRSIKMNAECHKGSVRCYH